jgi:hypothetical protein
MLKDFQKKNFITEGGYNVPGRQGKWGKGNPGTEVNKPKTTKYYYFSF